MIYKLNPKSLKGLLKVLVLFLPLGLGQHVFAQEESSPILEQKEKQSELKKIKSCEGISYSYDKNGTLSKEGHESSFETYNKLGDLIETILYSSEEKISEITQSKYDSTGKLLDEEKIIPNQPTQKHIYYYKN